MRYRNGFAEKSEIYLDKDQKDNFVKLSN